MIEHEVEPSMDKEENKDELENQVLLEIKKPNEGDKLISAQEDFNDDVVDIQPIDEPLKGSVMVMGELCIAAQAHEQFLVEA